MEEVKKLLDMQDESDDSVSDDSSEHSRQLIVDDDPGTITSISDVGASDSTKGVGKQGTKSVSDGTGTSKGSQREFVSYVKVNHNEDTKDPDGLIHKKRMDLENLAIDLVRSEEPDLKTTSTHNPGFDLTEEDSNGNTVRWIEVKGMRGTLNDRPATLTSTQFKFAQKRRDAYWLYIVEKAGERERATIIRIKDPAGKAETFTFDKGWASVSENRN